MNLEMLAMLRAEEQMEAGAWKRIGSGDRSEESEKIRLCEVPGCEREIDQGAWGSTKRCPACVSAKMAVTPCKVCGGPLRRKDQTSVTKGRRGICQACRGDMPQVQRGAENLVIARAARAAREAA